MLRVQLINGINNKKDMPFGIGNQSVIYVNTEDNIKELRQFANLHGILKRNLLLCGLHCLSDKAFDILLSYTK